MDQMGGCGHQFHWGQALDISDGEPSELKLLDLDTSTLQTDLSSLSAYNPPSPMFCGRCDEPIYGTRFECIRCAHSRAICWSCLSTQLLRQSGAPSTTKPPGGNRGGIFGTSEPFGRSASPEPPEHIGHVFELVQAWVTHLSPRLYLAETILQIRMPSVPIRSTASQTRAADRLLGVGTPPKRWGAHRRGCAHEGRGGCACPDGPLALGLCVSQARAAHGAANGSFRSVYLGCLAPVPHGVGLNATLREGGSCCAGGSQSHPSAKVRSCQCSCFRSSLCS